MSRDVFILPERSFQIECIGRSYEAFGADVSGDLDYLVVEGDFDRFYLTASTIYDDSSPWIYFEPDQSKQVRDIIGLPSWFITITANASHALNAGILGFPQTFLAAVENDNGLVLSLDAAREAASNGIEWLKQSSL